LRESPNIVLPDGYLSVMPKISVAAVVPCFRIPAYLRSAISSLLVQTHKHIEVHVVSDGCPDKPEEVIADLLQSDDRLRFWRKTNGGVASTRNYGLARLGKDVDYVMFLDGDDCLKPNAIAEMVGALEANPDAGMVHCEPEFIDEANRVISEKKWLPRYAWKNSRVAELGAEDRETPFESVYGLAGIIPTLTLFRRRTLEQTPGYDEHFGQHYEDTDLNLQVAIRSRVIYLPQKLAMYRVRAGQSSSDVSRHAPQLEKLRRKWHSLSGLSEAQRCKVRFAEWFVDYPLAAKTGWEACGRAVAEGQWFAALRFGQGALRRDLLGRFRQPAQ